MRKIVATLETGFCGGDYEENFEFEDDVTDSEIEEEIESWAWSCINLNWEEVEAFGDTYNSMGTVRHIE